MSKIQALPQILVNQIAAGEVIERPAAVVKELVENAIDAGATKIDIALEDGGKSLIRIKDNGHGMSQADLPMALQRHATSKINAESDLLDIASLGFRGEALPSIASVARLKITSRLRDNDQAWSLQVEGDAAGLDEKCEPASFDLAHGTLIEVRDLFFATPARLKFLKTDAAETHATTDLLKHLALCYPQVHFTFTNFKRTNFDWPAPQGESDIEQMQNRIAMILDADIAGNMVPVEYEQDGIALQGLIGLPTLHARNRNQQFTFVNGRPVKDKVCQTAIHVGYKDFMSHHVYPITVLFMKTPKRFVDANVHPAKTEVRFQDAQLAKQAMIRAIRRTLTAHGHATSSTVLQTQLQKFTADAPNPQANLSIPLPQSNAHSTPSYRPRLAPQPQYNAIATASVPLQEHDYSSTQTVATEAPTSPPLGFAKTQVFETYILAQAEDGLVIVDQHAAHERIVYEQLKQGIAANDISQQKLLLPVIVELSESEVDALLNKQELLRRYGVELEQFGIGGIQVTAWPTVLPKDDIKSTIKDVVSDIIDNDEIAALEDKIMLFFATHACHHSIRAGRTLSNAEMDALLRDMESTPHSGQCNHGRPTYVKLSQDDIEHLFGRH